MIPANICVICIHLNGDRKCSAFLDQIPEVIWVGQVDHRQPYPGDNDIQFKAKKETDRHVNKFLPQFD